MEQAERGLKGPARIAALCAGAVGVLALPAATELRVARAMRPLTDRWRYVAVAPRGSTLLGFSFRPRQVDALGLEPRATLEALLAYPFQIVRLGAYWDHIETEPSHFRFDELDWQLDAAERAGKRVIVCVGAVKTFGYPEFFVPAHRLPQPLREGALVTPATHGPLLGAAIDFITRLVERYSERSAIVAWQLEHEAVDPLGMEHSWRLEAGFVRGEVAAVRVADPTRPIVMNGFLPTSLPVRLQQLWRTRDQGDSLDVAQQMADIVGIDYYPRHALASAGAWTLYLDGSGRSWNQQRRRRLFAQAQRQGRQLMITEGQAEPWEAVTSPPNPAGRGMYSCLPERMIETYNTCISWARDEPAGLYAYLFWGAEYWIGRRNGGDPRYLQAIGRVLEQS